MWFDPDWELLLSYTVFMPKKLKIDSIKILPLHGNMAFITELDEAEKYIRKLKKDGYDIFIKKSEPFVRIEIRVILNSGDILNGSMLNTRRALFYLKHIRSFIEGGKKE